MYYSLAKFTHSPVLANGLSGTINLLATIPAMIFVGRVMQKISTALLIVSLLQIDRWGRRPTMITGAILCSVCICILAILSGVHGFAYSTVDSILQQDMPSANTGKSGNPLYLIFDANGATIGFLIVMYVCVAIYSCTWGTLGWIYPAEL